jgi:Tfp pilus assembly protein PilN
MSVFRVNLYAERSERRAAARGRLLRAAAEAALVSVAGLVVTTIVISGLLLRERESALAADVARLNELLAPAPASDQEMGLAREIFAVRRARIEWSPKLAALAEAVDDGLVLDSFQGQSPQERIPAAFEIEGGGPDGDVDLDKVSAFVARLREDRRVTDGFAAVKLGNIRSGNDGFLVVGVPVAGPKK